MCLVNCLFHSPSSAQDWRDVISNAWHYWKLHSTKHWCTSEMDIDRATLVAIYGLGYSIFKRSTSRLFQSLLFASALLNSRSTWCDVTVISKYWNRNCICSLPDSFPPWQKVVWAQHYMALVTLFPVVFFLLLHWSRRVMKSEEGLVMQKSLSYRYMLNSLPWLAKMPSK